MYLEENMIWKDTCSPVFIATLLTIAKMWKQAQCPSAEAWIKMWRRTDLWTQRGKQKVGQIERVALQYIDCHMSNRQPVEFAVWHKESNLSSGTTYKVGRRFKREGTYVYLWLIHVDVWQKPTQHCKTIILQLKIKKKKMWYVYTIEYYSAIKKQWNNAK